MSSNSTLLTTPLAWLLVLAALLVAATAKAVEYLLELVLRLLTARKRSRRAALRGRLAATRQREKKQLAHFGNED
jgi:hypothetical protein